jgi:cell division protein FtsB
MLVGAICLVALLYYRPVRAYMQVRDEVTARRAEVRQLDAQHQAYLQRVELNESGATLLRDARRLSLVKPGEKLFIVRGISAWRHAHGRTTRQQRR